MVFPYLLCLAVLVGVLEPAPSAAAETLWPAGAFDLRRSLPAQHPGRGFRVHAAQAEAGELYFLLCPATTRENCMIAVTDSYGRWRRDIRIGDGYVHAFAIGPDGQCHVSYGIPYEEIVTYHPGGQRAATRNQVAVTALVTLPNGGLLEATAEGNVRMRGEGVVPTIRGRWSEDLLRRNLPSRFFLLPTSVSTVAAVDGVTARLEILNVQNGEKTVRLLDTPEIREAKLLYAKTVRGPAVAGVVIGAAAADTQTGQIYLFVAGNRSDRGIPVLRLHPDGSPDRTLRCSLPPRGGGLPGEILVHAMWIHKGILFIADSEGVVGLYYLSPRTGE
jgi:hypothetical protein